METLTGDSEEGMEAGGGGGQVLLKLHGSQLQGLTIPEAKDFFKLLYNQLEITHF